MRLITQTMTIGGYLMPQMYINRLVWKQEKVQIYEVDKKMDFFRELKNKMEILSIKKKTNQFSKDYKEV